MSSPLLAIRGLEKTSTEFRQKLCDIAYKLGLNANYLAAVMCVETGGTFSPSIRNPYTHAVGLIQFMPKTALALLATNGFSGFRSGAPEDDALNYLSGLSAVEQLDYVRLYYEQCGALGKIRYDVPGDYYMSVFMPAHVGRPGDYILFQEGTKGYEQNKGLDKDVNGLIEVRDVWATVDRVVDEAVKRGVLGVNEIEAERE